MTWATSLTILILLGFSVLDLGLMYAKDRQTDVRRASSLNAPYPRGGGITKCTKNARTDAAKKKGVRKSRTLKKLQTVAKLKVGTKKENCEKTKSVAVSRR